MDRNSLVLNTIQNELSKPYEYGVADCFMMACAVVDVVSGTNHCEVYAGRYTSLKGAQKALRIEGHKSLVGFWGELLDPISPALAQYGDIAVVDINGVEHCAVCFGDFISKEKTGQTRFALSDVKAAFKV